MKNEEAVSLSLPLVVQSGQNSLDARRITVSLSLSMPRPRLLAPGLSTFPSDSDGHAEYEIFQ